MLIRSLGEKLLVVTQPDHAELAGQFAAHWGNGRFSPPDPFEAVVVATTEHDNGWREWDNRPTLNPESRQPYDFLSLPTPEHLRLYRRGIQRAVECDPYVGLLVSMHGMGLYNQRFGTDPVLVRKYAAEEEKRLASEFISEQEHLQAKLRQLLREQPEYRRVSGDSHVWVNYKLLQIWDRLSVYLCIRGASDLQLAPTPTGYSQGEDVPLTIRRVSESRIAISPYPFSISPLRFSLRARLLPKPEFRDEGEMREALYRAERVELSFEATQTG